MADNGRERVRVTVCGSELNIVTDESAQSVRDAAKTVDETVGAIMKGNFRISAKEAALLCAMDFFSECEKYKSRCAENSLSLSESETELNGLRAELEKIREELSLARENLARAREDLSQTSENLAQTSAELEEQKKTNEELNARIAELMSVASANTQRTRKNIVSSSNDKIFTPCRREDLADMTREEKIEYIGKLMREDKRTACGDSCETD